MDVTEIVTAVIGLVAVVSTGIRLVPRWRPEDNLVLVAHVLTVVIMSSSQSWIYEPLDRVFGGRNVVNLIAHLALIGVTWISAALLIPALRGRSGTLPRWSWMPVAASMVGAVSTFIALGTQHTSRGLDAYDSEILYGFYWCFTLMGIWFPSPWLVPRLWARRATSGPRIRASFLLFAVSYALSIPCTLSFFLVAWRSDWILLREALVLGMGATLVAGYLVAPTSRHQKANKSHA